MPRCAICDTELSPYQAADDDLCGTCHQEVDRVFYDPDIQITCRGELLNILASLLAMILGRAILIEQNMKRKPDDQRDISSPRRYRTTSTGNGLCLANAAGCRTGAPRRSWTTTGK